MHNFKTFLLVSSICISALSIQAQISEVLYKMDYNIETDLYDCKIVIQKGSANNALHRLQLNSQFSIVVPTGSAVSIEALHMPLKNNMNFGGTQPTEWYIGSQISHPASQPESDYYGIIPRLAPVSHYNTLNEGEEVVLFSLRIEGENICERNVRVYNREVDPSSSSAGMEGGDFRNGMTIGSLSQLYIGNKAKEEKMKASMDDVQLCIGECLTLAPVLECKGYPITYQWSTGEHSRSIEVCPTESTVYAVTIVDGNDELTVVENEIKVLDDGTAGCNDIFTSTSNTATNFITYPNPAMDIVNFESSSFQESIALLDVYGRTVSIQKDKIRGNFNIDHLQSGTYFLKFVTRDEPIVRSFIKI